MKKKLTILICTMLFVCCKRDFLDRQPTTSGTTDEFYNTQQDIINADNAIYAVLQLTNASDYMVGDITTDDAEPGAGTCLSGVCDFNFFDVEPSISVSSTVLNTRWTSLYKGISRANILLNRIDGVTFNDPVLKTRIIGEAKFLRAYFYFSLVQTFGDVPLIVKELSSPDETYAYPRMEKAKVYAQIQQDLTDASTALPSTYTGADIGRATKWAALGLLGRVYIFQGNFTDAAPVLKNIIDNTTSIYGFLSNYADVFKYNNGNNKEIIFSIQYSRGFTPSQGRAAHANFIPMGTQLQPIGGQGYNLPTTDLDQAFEPNDARKAATESMTITVGTVTSALPHVNKYLDPAVLLANDTSVDFPVLRYSDVLLMYAECLNETGNPGGGVVYLNKVRTTPRTNLPAKPLTINQSDLRIAILKERRIEFAFESLRFFDLVRTNNLETVMNAYFTKYNITNNGVLVQIDAHNRLFPIPQQQIDTNPQNIKQNPGYK
jgi:starch-binding outer membrane protein, SusD/RagB family